MVLELLLPFRQLLHHSVSEVLEVVVRHPEGISRAHLLSDISFFVHHSYLVSHSFDVPLSERFNRDGENILIFSSRPDGTMLSGHPR